eukprot:TRINITY_DN6670_c0_g2_i1.p2 TRINITY_DN6670_c0_g2~~TRINITY_DN6670_c0_g2_i1.p2  ORF type:complete len:217 (+),score=63.38 TRINITY_DN6670_c0_g2_i1:334-984(+)
MKGYTQKTVLGNKGFGKTYLVSEKEGGTEYSMKIVDVSKLGPNEFARSWFFPQMSRKWNHPNLVPLVESFVIEEAQQCAFVSEYCEGRPGLIVGGSLDKLIEEHKRRGERIEEREILEVIHEILQGLIFIKHNGVIHKNLKPSNIFLQPRIRIGDFVLSAVFKGYGDYPYPSGGELAYVSPELLQRNEMNTSTDVWALGCIAYEMCCLTVRRGAEA